MRLLLAVLAVPPLTATLGAAAVAGPPASRTEPVKETVQGVEIVDPYRWLEGDATGKVTPEVAAWTDAQDAYTRSVLDGLPGRKAVEDALRPLMEIGTVGAPTVRGGRYFYDEREGSQNQASVMVREGVAGRPRVLLDPAKIDPSGLLTIEWSEPSEDGKLLAYGSYRSGDENTTLHLLDVDSGKTLPLEIPNKVRGVSWLPDASGFVYKRLAAPKNPYSNEVRFHRTGTDPAQDALLLRQFTAQENPKLATTFGPFGYTSRDGKWLILGYSTGTRTNDLWAVDFDLYRRNGQVVKVPITVGEEAQSYGPVVDGVLYMRTTLEAPNGRIVAVPLANPKRAAWRVIVPERKDATLEGVSLGRGALALQYLHNASSKVEVIGLDGKSKGELKLPGIGSAAVTADERSSEAFVSFTSFNYPSTILRVDLDHPQAEPVQWARPAVPVDPSTVEVKQEWYTSKDGTRVSLFVVHRKGLVLNGENPTFLTGYGGFAVSEMPYFSATLFQWFAAGGVFALPNLRGGGEYGEAWHAGGMLGKKQNVFDDFIAAAEHLIAARYTSPRHLAIFGGSNGGLLTGAALTQRPDLFRAVVSAVPLLDMLRYQNFLMARFWIPEYGSAEDPTQFQWLYAYSPYHHVKPGTHYPAVLLTAGENDVRVHPSHARKMTALLQAVAAGVPDGKPVLLWVDREAGHGQGKPLNLRLRDVVDQRTFLMWQLGVLGGDAAAPPAAKP